MLEIDNLISRVLFKYEHARSNEKEIILVCMASYTKYYIANLIILLKKKFHGC